MFGPCSFINVIGGRKEEDEDGRSRKNMVEVAIVLKLLRNLYKSVSNFGVMLIFFFQCFNDFNLQMFSFCNIYRSSFICNG